MRPAVARARGWAALLLCLVLVNGSALAAAWVHRWAVEQERLWSAAWAHTQAQALGQGGLMWALARLEDPRPMDAQCRALATPHSVMPSIDSFAMRMARPGGHLRCVVDLGQASGADAWQCDCSQGAATPAWSSGDSMWQARIDIDFSGSADALRLRVKTQLRRGSQESAVWQESVGIRKDRLAVWRSVIGSWQDAR